MAQPHVAMKLVLVVLCYLVLATFSVNCDKACGADPLVFNLDKFDYGQEKWTNPSYPMGDTKPLNCKLTVFRTKQKLNKTEYITPADTYVQMKITFEEFFFKQPNRKTGICEADKLVITGGNQRLVKTPASFCGAEYNDTSPYKTRVIRHYSHRYIHFNGNEEVDTVDLTITTTNGKDEKKPLARKFKITILGVKANQVQTAPIDCYQNYLVNAGEPLVIKTFNYPLSQLVTSKEDIDYPICFYSGSKRRTFEYIKLIPDASRFDKKPFTGKPFLIGQGTKDTTSQTDAGCATYARLEDPLPKTKPTPKSFCGSYINEAAKSKKDANVTFVSTDNIDDKTVYKFVLKGSTKPSKRGFRFQVEAPIKKK